MAKRICIDVREFEGIFERFESEYADYGRFMEPDELPSDFKGTRRWDMLLHFRATMKQIKRKIEIS